MRSEFVRSVSTLIYGSFVLLFSWQSIRAEKPQPREKGIWRNQQAKYQLAGQHEKLLVASLRRITGFQQLDFLSNGALVVNSDSMKSRNSKIDRQIPGSTFDSFKT